MDTAKTLLTAKLVWIMAFACCLLLPAAELLALPMPTDIGALGQRYMLLSLLVSIPTSAGLAAASLAFRLLGLDPWRLLKRLESIPGEEAKTAELLRLSRARYVGAVAAAELIVVAGVVLGAALRVPILVLPYAFVALLCLWLSRPSALSDALATVERQRR